MQVNKSALAANSYEGTLNSVARYNLRSYHNFFIGRFMLNYGAQVWSATSNYGNIFKVFQCHTNTHRTLVVIESIANFKLLSFRFTTQSIGAHKTTLWLPTFTIQRQRTTLKRLLYFSTGQKTACQVGNKVTDSVTRKKVAKCVKKLPQKIISTTLQKLPQTRVIWANNCCPQALKICPNCNKSPDLVTLVTDKSYDIFQKLKRLKILTARNVDPIVFRKLVLTSLSLSLSLFTSNENFKKHEKFFFLLRKM